MRDEFPGFVDLFKSTRFQDFTRCHPEKLQTPESPAAFRTSMIDRALAPLVSGAGLKEEFLILLPPDLQAQRRKCPGGLPMLQNDRVK